MNVTRMRVAIGLAGLLTPLLSGCTELPSTPLDQLHNPRLDVRLSPNETVWLEVSTDDPSPDCLALDPDTDVTIANRHTSWGSPSRDLEDDDCPPVTSYLDLRETPVDESSPTRIRVADDSLTMEMSVPGLFAERRIQAPSAIYTCTSALINYASAGEPLKPEDVSVSLALASGHTYSLPVTDVNAGFIHVMGPFAVPSGTEHGTLQIDIRAHPPITRCSGAASCSVTVEVELAKQVSFSDGCDEP